MRDIQNRKKDIIIPVSPITANTVPDRTWMAAAI